MVVGHVVDGGRSPKELKSGLLSSILPSEVGVEAGVVPSFGCKPAGAGICSGFGLLAHPWILLSNGSLRFPEMNSEGVDLMSGRRLSQRLLEGGKSVFGCAHTRKNCSDTSAPLMALAAALVLMFHSKRQNPQSKNWTTKAL